MGYLKGFSSRSTSSSTRSSGAIVTTEYSGGHKKDQHDQKSDKPTRLHGRHVLNRYEDGMEKCIGCELCAGVCPARCIYVRGPDNDPESPTSPGERFGFVYEINYLRCIHCDLCVEACPTEAITESKLFEFSFTNRQDAIYTKAELVVSDDGKPQQMPWEDWRPARTSTPRRGCGPPPVGRSPTYEGRSVGRASSATACALPSRGSTDGARSLRRRRGAHHRGRRARA